MPHADIPRMLGRVLSGSKYQLRQARGRFGLGAKMALIWSKMTTARPLQIFSARRDQGFITVCRLDIDIHKNEPNVLEHRKAPNDGTLHARFPAGWHGTEISVDIEGLWSGTGGSSSYKWKILRYMRRLAVITPYAQFTFQFADPGRPKDDLAIRYARRTDVIPRARRVEHRAHAPLLLLLTASPSHSAFSRQALRSRSSTTRRPSTWSSCRTCSVAPATRIWSGSPASFTAAGGFPHYSNFWQTLAQFLVGSFSEISSRNVKGVVDGFGDQFSLALKVNTLVGHAMHLCAWLVSLRVA